MKTPLEDGNLLSKMRSRLALITIVILVVLSFGCSHSVNDNPKQVIQAFFSSIKKGDNSSALSYWSFKNNKQKNLYQKIVRGWVNKRKSFNITDTGYFGDNIFLDKKRKMDKAAKMVAFDVNNSSLFTLEKINSRWKITAYINVQGGFNKIFNTKPYKARDYQDFINKIIKIIKNNSIAASYPVINSEKVKFGEFNSFAKIIKNLDSKILFIGSPSDLPNDGNLVRIGNANQKIYIYFSNNKINKFSF